jgi:hypothetical protein
MSHHHYPTTALYPDYLRVAFGLTLTAGPLLLLDLATVPAWLLGGLALLFGWFGLRTGMRQLSSIELSPEALAVHGPLRRRLAWRQLERLKLAYYAPRRARDGGWLQLTLRGAEGRPIRMESSLDGFDQVLRRAVDAAAANGLELDPTTEANLASLGLAEPGETVELAHSGGVSWPGPRPGLWPQRGRRGSP